MSSITQDSVAARPAVDVAWWPIALAAPVLAASAFLPGESPVWCALGAIIVLGVPHGALDGEVARDLFRPRFGWAWFAVFSLPYLALSALVLVGWRVAPSATLALFLLASVLHFGIEDAATSSWLERLARGGLPIAVPSLVQPTATAALFATVTGHPLPALPLWWLLPALAWTGLFAVWAWELRRRHDWGRLGRMTLIAAAFAALPPLTAFAIYFVGIHAPLHTAAMIADPRRASRVRDEDTAWTRALPLTVLTLLLGALLWPLYAGGAAPRLTALTIQGLAALTLPHILLDGTHDRLQSMLRISPSG